MHSRSQLTREWCKVQPLCYLASNLCSDLVEDYDAARNLMDRYPGRIRIVRYEDLALDPMKETEKIMQFFGFPMAWKVKHFLKQHTKANASGDYSTFRNSTATALSWIKDYPFDEVGEVIWVSYNRS